LKAGASIALAEECEEANEQSGVQEVLNSYGTKVQ